MQQRYNCHFAPCNSGNGPSLQSVMLFRIHTCITEQNLVPQHATFLSLTYHIQKYASESGMADWTKKWKYWLNPKLCHLKDPHWYFFPISYLMFSWQPCFLVGRQKYYAKCCSICIDLTQTAIVVFQAQICRLQETGSSGEGLGKHLNFCMLIHMHLNSETWSGHHYFTQQPTQEHSPSCCTILPSCPTVTPVPRLSQRLIKCLGTKNYGLCFTLYWVESWILTASGGGGGKGDSAISKNGLC